VFNNKRGIDMKKKILVIDDEVDLVDLVKMRLEANNYYVMPLYTSTRSIEIVKREKPDLILLDVMMPDKDGYAVCRELKADKDTKDIPVVLFTAKDQQKNAVKKDYQTSGADDYIIKPFEASELLAKIEKFIKT